MERSILFIIGTVAAIAIVVWQVDYSDKCRARGGVTLKDFNGWPTCVMATNPLRGNQ